MSHFAVSYGEILRKELDQIGLSIAPPIQRRLALYCSEVARWNQRLNLTALEGAVLVRRLVLEPVWIAERLQMAGSLVDIGSGNGSPAVPMSLSRDLTATRMVESRTKRAVFLRHLLSVLSLRNAEVHKGRFEEVCGNLGPADWVTLQAVSPTRAILQGIPRISIETTIVVWITSGVSPESKVPTKEVVNVPFSSTKALILALDQS